MIASYGTRRKQRGLRCAVCASLFVLTICHPAFGGHIKIAWNPNSESDLAGYKVYYGTAPWSFGEPIDVKNVTSYTITDLPAGKVHYIAVTAYDTDGNESGFSNQVSGEAHDILYGERVFNVSRGDSGGVVIRFGEGDAFSGYGISGKLDFFRIEGTYNFVEGETTFHGVYQMDDFFDPGLHLGSGNISGSIDEAKNSMTLNMNRPLSKVVGNRFVRDPAVPAPGIPGEWAAKLSGRLRASIDPLLFRIYPVDGDPGSHLYAFSESGIPSNLGQIDMDGLFLLTLDEKAYGIFETSGSRSDSGFFSGSFGSDQTQFTFSLKGDKMSRYTLKGQQK